MGDRGENKEKEESGPFARTCVITVLLYIAIESNKLYINSKRTLLQTAKTS